MRVHRKSNLGFTLLETLLSIAIIGLIAGISIPVYQSFQVRNDLDIGATTIAQNARRAQLLAQGSLGDTSWGINVQNGSIVLFKGASYVGRDTTFDEIFDLPTSLTQSGITGVVYTKFTGLPETTGSITLTSTSNETRTVTINTKGTVSF